MAGPKKLNPGKVYLVGAGPGDPGMLTLRGQACLQMADVVLYDYLANPRLLRWAEQAERICLGKHGKGRVFSQDEINRKIVELAQAGKSVVRLKGGDPAIFARAHEELAEIVRHGIPYEIVPGITAALSVTSTVGIPLTHRDHASAVALVTGQGKSGGPESHIDYQALANFPGTLVFYMGTTTVEQWSSELIKAGMDPNTPVLATRNCSLPNQTSLSCKLNEIAGRVNQETKLRPPVLFVVGKSAESFGEFNWFESRPLFGKTVLVTRPSHQTDGLRVPLEELGAEVVEQPAIEIASTCDRKEVTSALTSMDQYDWVVFSSVNGVRFLMDAFLKDHDIRKLAGVRLAAVGPATAKALEDFHLKTDLVPESFDADCLAKELSPKVKEQRVLLIRASRGREVLFEELSKSAADVQQLVCYSSTDVNEADPNVAARLQAGEFDFTTITSSAIAKSMVGLFGEHLKNTRLVSISPVTTATLNELGFPPELEAETYTIEGIVAAIQNGNG